MSRRPPGAHEAPAHQPHPQQGFDERHGSVSGGEDAPVDLGHSWTDIRESVVPSTTVPTSTTRPKRATWPSGSGGEGTGHEECTRGVQPGNPSAKAVTQRYHLLILSLFTRLRRRGFSEICVRRRTVERHLKAAGLAPSRIYAW